MITSKRRPFPWFNVLAWVFGCSVLGWAWTDELDGLLYGFLFATTVLNLQIIGAWYADD